MEANRFVEDGLEEEEGITNAAAKPLRQKKIVIRSFMVKEESYSERGLLTMLC